MIRFWTGTRSGIPWSVKIKRSALKELARIAKTDRQRIVRAVDDLPETPYRGSALKGEPTRSSRIRIRSYRVIYEVQKKELIVLAVAVGLRGSVYR